MTKYKRGTQADLDAAKDDARLIPKKTYFMCDSKLVYRIDSPDNDKYYVCMFYAEHGSITFCDARDLEPVNE